MDRIQAFQAFTCVVELGSFARAAEKLSLSTTSVSRQVAELEAHLGTLLLQRTTRQVRLTEEGKRFYSRATQVLSDIEEAEAEVGAVATTPRGRLRVNLPLTFGIQHIAPLLPAFRVKYPLIDLDISVTDRMVDIVEEGYDMAVRITVNNRPTHIARPITKIRLVVAAAPEYLARHGTPTVLEDLRQHNCLANTGGGLADSWPFVDASGLVQVPIKGSFRADNGDILRLAALAGEGIIYEPTFILGPDLEAGRLVPLLSDWSYPPVMAVAVYPTRRHLSAKIRVFVEFLQQAFTEEPPWDHWLRRGSAGPTSG